MTMQSDRETARQSLIPPTGMPLISKPVNGQYTMIIVEKSPMNENGTSCTRFSTFTNGRRAAVMATRGRIFRRVRIFSVMPEREMPAMFMAQNAEMTRISMARTCPIPKNEKYCPIPAAMVAMPKTDETT